MWDRFKHPVVLYCWSFQGDTPVNVPFVLCFGVDFLCGLNRMCISYFFFYLSSGN